MIDPGVEPRKISEAEGCLQMVIALRKENTREVERLLLIEDGMGQCPTRTQAEIYLQQQQQQGKTRNYKLSVLTSIRG